MTGDLWTHTQAERATGGRAVGTWTISGISIDTRSIKAGDFFVPLKDQRDGHDFIPQARSGGAGAIMSERPNEPAPALIVKDTVAALRDLGIAARKRSQALRVAVTGSVGKTSVKEAIALICADQGITHKSKRSFNNHWGVPMTLATMPTNTQYGVFEVGMNHAGELSDLSPLVGPHVAVVTKIAPAHLAHFDNVDGIAAAKAEIFEGLMPGGVAVINADDDYFEFLSKKARAQGAKIISFGKAEYADVRVRSPHSDAGGIRATFDIKGVTYALDMALHGEHWIANAACAIAVATALDFNVEQALKSLSKMSALSGRGETFSVVANSIEITVIDESYNANPESMRASIATLGGFSARRKIAVLGDMFELGKDELEMHAALSDPLMKAEVSRVIVVGECMRALRGALPQPMRAAWAKSWQEALNALQEELQDGDVVLVKGSNANGLGDLVAGLKTIHNIPLKETHNVV